MSLRTGSASSSLEALTQQYQAITANLANANTTAYKRRTSAFAQSLQEQLAGQAPGEAGGVIATRMAVDFSQGRIVETGRPLDLALDGEGFFVLETPAGPVYTRNGTFQLSDTSQLVDAAGRTVAGEGGPISVPAAVGLSQVTVSPDGNIWAGAANIGKLKVVKFDDRSVLQPVGASCFQAPASAAPEPAAARVHQKHQESSNVSVVGELVGLIAVTRLYEANIKSISMQDERTKSILQVAMG